MLEKLVKNGDLIGSLVMGACVALTFGCRDGIPEVLESKRVPSPDGKLVVTDELVTNGLGIGASTVYEEIHLAAPDAKFEHGDKDTSSILYMIVGPTDTMCIRVNWLDSRTLVIGYPLSQSPAKRVPHLEGVDIRYETFASDRGPAATVRRGY